MRRLLKTRFSGYLKQLDTDGIGGAEAELFDLLFPRFKSASRQVFDLLPARPRRFGWYKFPRGRYYSLTFDDKRVADQTLAHELRAYRNARYFGFIDVFDMSCEQLGVGFETAQGKRRERLKPDLAIAVARK